MRVTTREGPVIEYYIDAATYYVNKTLSKTSTTGQNMDSTITLTDYTKTDAGYVMAYSQTNSLGDGTINANKVVINQPIDPAIFALPT